MKWKITAALATAIGLAGAALLPGCSDDPATPVRPTPRAYENLTEKWHPLNNLEQAIRRRDIEHYREALDADYYMFFFSDSDFSSGKTDEFWTYNQDTGGAAKMLDPQLPDLNRRAVTLDFDLVFGRVQWDAVDPSDAPDETWYKTTVGYTFYIVLGDGVHAYIQGPGASIQITVRQNPSDGKWRIVQMDDMPGTAQTAPAGQGRAGRYVEETSFGQIKALYEPPETGFKDLREIWHPLNNLEEAIRQRDIQRYRLALDADYYTFFFSGADYSSGKTPESWTYLPDTQAAARMLDPQLPDLNLRAVNLDFDIIFDKDNIVWQEVVPTDPPDETWYKTTIGYTYYVKLGDGIHEYIQAPGASVTITVRHNPDDGRWRIVRMDDLPGTALSTTPNQRLAARSMEESSFGQIKVLFTPEG